MHGDLSRLTFRAGECFSRVLLQQGRPQLDADYNELVAVMLHWQRELAKDLLGPDPRITMVNEMPLWHGTMANIADMNAVQDFRIQIIDNQLQIGPGRYYVNGILCENTLDPLLFVEQNGFPFSDSDSGGQDGNYLLYLDAWERFVSPGEDDQLREPALLGADTAARSRIVWQVKAQLLGRNELHTGMALIRRDQTMPKLQARIQPGDVSTDPCTTSPDSGYRGVENQLYRVEIHSVRKEAGEAGRQISTFKWSRENGSVVFSVLSFGKPTGDQEVKTVQCTVGDLGRDSRRTVHPGDWVEVLEKDTALTGRSGLLLKVHSVDRDENKITFRYTANPDDTNLQLPANPVLLRRWDQQANVEQIGDPPPIGYETGAVKVVEDDDYIELECGVEVRFVKPKPASPDPPPDAEPERDYRAGDFWLIPARVEKGDILWPKVDGASSDHHNELVPKELPPRGINHHYAPLGTVRFKGGQLTKLADHRRVILRIGTAEAEAHPGPPQIAISDLPILQERGVDGIKSDVFARPTS